MVNSLKYICFKTKNRNTKSLYLSADNVWHCMGMEYTTLRIFSENSKFWSGSNVLAIKQMDSKRQVLIQ